jgi:phosphoserine phosphatase RsbX
MNTTLTLDLGVASYCPPGRTDCGDCHVVRPIRAGALLGVLDGLGQGPEAFEAARLAAGILEDHAEEPIASLVARCHERLRSTRGVVMSLAVFSHESASLTWAGVGNVEGLLVRADPSHGRRCEVLVGKAGVVGVHVPPLDPKVLSVADGDTMIFTTDGIRGDFLDLVSRSVPTQSIANRILRSHLRGTDDALVLVARYLGVGS